MESGEQDGSLSAQVRTHRLDIRTCYNTRWAQTGPVWRAKQPGQVAGTWPWGHGPHAAEAMSSTKWQSRSSGRRLTSMGWGHFQLWLEMKPTAKNSRDDNLTSPAGSAPAQALDSETEGWGEIVKHSIAPAMRPFFPKGYISFRFLRITDKN